MNSCNGHGMCGLRGTCSCWQGWTGWSCGRLLGAFGLALLARLDGSLVGSQVQLGAGWSAQGSVMRNGLGNVAGWSATEALQHLIEGSMPFPAHLPASAQVRFSKDTNSVQLRMGSKGGSGVFYVWHAADDAAAHLRLEASDAPAFIDILCTQGALAGHYKGLLFSSPQGKVEMVLGPAGGGRPALPTATHASFAIAVTLMMLAKPNAQPSSPWPWPPSPSSPSSLLPTRPAPASQYQAGQQQTMQAATLQGAPAAQATLQGAHPQAAKSQAATLQAAPAAQGGGVAAGSGSYVTPAAARAASFGALGGGAPAGYTGEVTLGSIQQGRPRQMEEGVAAEDGVGVAAEDGVAPDIQALNPSRPTRGVQQQIETGSGDRSGDLPGASNTNTKSEDDDLRQVLQTCHCCLSETNSQSEACCGAVDKHPSQAAALCREMLSSSPLPSSAPRKGRGGSAASMARERVGDEGALSGGLDGAFDRGDDDGSDALQHLQDGSDELQESAMLPSNGARLATHGNGLAVASLGAMRTGGMRKGKGKVPKDSNKPTDPPARGFYTSIYDLIHVSMTVWVGAALMVFGATLLLIKRCCKGKNVGAGSRKYGHYRMVGLTGSAPASDEMSPYD